MIPDSHRGAWRGPNRLWFEDPKSPERSDGLIDAEASSLRYRWSFRGAPQEGELRLAGPAGAVRGDWKDSWHMSNGAVMHGHAADGVLVLYGTYPAGDGPDWGWRIELDWRDPEHLSLRMFNLEPAGPAVPAVDLRGARA
jgi:hypothetical protein